MADHIPSWCDMVPTAMRDTERLCLSTLSGRYEALHLPTNTCSRDRSNGGTLEHAMHCIKQNLVTESTWEVPHSDLLSK